MTKRPTKYLRCKKCKELVIDPDNCANCAAKNPLGFSGRWNVGQGKKGPPTLDVQESNRDD